MTRRRPNSRFATALAVLACLLPLVGFAQAAREVPAATFTVDAKLGGDSGQHVGVVLSCRSAAGEAVHTEQATLADGETVELRLPGPPAGGVDCVVTADHSAGLSIGYRGDGGSEVDISDAGCRFLGVTAGHANFCQVRVEARVTSITVYKKWIGARGDEDDVLARLHCGGAAVPEPLPINAGRPGTWTLEVTEADGILCQVTEDEREDFVPDMTDCRDLLVLPGTQEECTLVNTKVVKMIDMLNRYGLGIMIAVFAVAGMLAARKFVP